MSTIRIATNFNIDLEFTAAPFHRRLFAWVLDIIVLIFYIYIAIKIIDSFDRSFSSYDQEGLWMLMMVLMLPLLTYHLLSEVLMNGQSIGKRIMGLRVISENGSKPSISQYIIRWLIRTSDYMVVVIAIYAPTGFGGSASFMWQVAAAFCLLIADIILVNASKKNQRLGDMLAHTLLIRTKERADIQDTIFLHVNDNYTPSFPQVMQLSDRDINALKGILDASRKQNDYDMAERAADKIKNHLKIESHLSAFDFLEILLKDYNYLSAN
jgi:uncharacterized RDD family membrane protein YckC